MLGVWRRITSKIAAIAERHRTLGDVHPILSSTCRRRASNFVPAVRQDLPDRALMPSVNRRSNFDAVAERPFRVLSGPRRGQTRSPLTTREQTLSVQRGMSAWVQLGSRAARRQLPLHPSRQTSGARAEMSVQCRYCCKSRKSNAIENLAKADLWASLPLHRLSAPLRRSVIDFG